jgi:uncharacterized damage-inducible protein DinB
MGPIRRELAIKDSLLPEFDQEMAATRRVLERLPEPSFGWRPHDRSYDLGGLATHLAQIPHWGASILKHEAHDLPTAGPASTALTSVTAVLDRFDRHVTEVRTALVAAPDGLLLAPWALRRGRHLILSAPRIAALRSFVLHHTIHHRGQMTVYLRVLGVPLPPLYGPTADESM